VDCPDNAGSIHNAPTQNTFNGFMAYDFQGSPAQSYGLYVASNCPQNTFVGGNMNNNKVAAKSILASACYYAGSTSGGLEHATNLIKGGDIFDTTSI
jgi:hypothetical protein